MAEVASPAEVVGAEPEGQPSLLAAVGSTALAKVLVMGTSGALAIFTSRLIISHFGRDAYVQYGLLASIPALLPFADLGVATVVVNNIAGSEDPRRDALVHRTITTAMRILLVSASVIMMVGALISVLGGWESLLGQGLIEGEGGLTAFLCMVVFALALPLTVGPRILVGLQRTALHVSSQAVVAPFIFGSVLVAAWLSLPIGAHLSVIAYTGNGLVNVICIVIAARLLSPQLRQAVRDIPRIRAVANVSVLPTAWPMLVQMVALPVAMQTDRILLSHLAPKAELASYNLASQLFGIVLQTIATAGIALWPVFARARARSELISPGPPTIAFLLGGLVLASGIAFASPWLVRFIASDVIELDRVLVGSFVLFVALQAAKYPAGMYMTDAAGLRFQVIPILLMVPLNIGVSWWLIELMGAAGAVLGSVISVLVCQVVPNLLYVRHDLGRRRRDASCLVTP